MQRETKVGLLVGLCVILLIGIIVSDHLSVVQRQDAPALTGFAPNVRSGLDTPQPAEAADPAPIPVEPRVPTPTGGPQIAARDQTHPIPAPPGDPAEADLNDHHPTGPAGALAGGAGTPGIPGPGNPVAPGNAGMTGNVDITHTAGNPPPTVQVLATHTVKRGDTLFQLARQYYHKGEKWKIIQEANRSVIGPDGQLKDGTSLVIPVIPGIDAPAVADAGATQGHANAADDGSPAAVRGLRTIRVQVNDTLGQLAQRYLGSSSRWKEIVDLNKDNLRQAGGLRAGMVLRLPDSQSATPASPVDTAFARTPITTGTPVIPARHLTIAPVPSPTRQTAAARPPSDTTTTTSTSGNNRQATPVARQIYIIQPDDSMASIALKTLGDGSEMQQRRLFEANRAVLAGETHLRAGQQLVIPTAAGRY